MKWSRCRWQDFVVKRDAKPFICITGSKHAISHLGLRTRWIELHVTSRTENAKRLLEIPGSNVDVEVISEECIVIVSFEVVWWVKRSRTLKYTFVQFEFEMITFLLFLLSWDGDDEDCCVLMTRTSFAMLSILFLLLLWTKTSRSVSQGWTHALRFRSWKHTCGVARPQSDRRCHPTFSQPRFEADFLPWLDARSFDSHRTHHNMTWNVTVFIHFSLPSWPRDFNWSSAVPIPVLVVSDIFAHLTRIWRRCQRSFLTVNSSFHSERIYSDQLYSIVWCIFHSDRLQSDRLS